MRIKGLLFAFALSGFAQSAELLIRGVKITQPLEGEVQSVRFIGREARFDVSEGRVVVSPWPLVWHGLPQGTRLTAEQAPHPSGPVSRFRLLKGHQPWLELISGAYAGTTVQDNWRLTFNGGKPFLVRGDEIRPFLQKMRLKDQAGVFWCLRLLAIQDVPVATLGIAQEAQIKADWLRFLPRKRGCE